MVAENAGTYTCQCSYNSDVVYNKGIVSNTAQFCLKVNTTSSPSTNTGKCNVELYIYIPCVLTIREEMAVLYTICVNSQDSRSFNSCYGDFVDRIYLL